MRAVTAHTGLQKSDIIVIIVSLVVGITLLAGNYMHYQQQETQYHISYDPDTEAAHELTITRFQSAAITFNLAQPEQLGDVAITVTYRSIGSDTVITPKVNGKTYETQQNLVSGASQTLSVEGSDLQPSNTLELSGEFSTRNNAIIQSVTVRGATAVQRAAFVILNIFGLLLILGPLLLIKYQQYKTRHILEEQFPNFLRDVVEGTRAGMPLPQAIQNTKNNNYDALSPYVNAMAAKLEWGIPFERVMEDFATSTNSRIVKRAVSTIIQTYRAGGNVTTVLETIGSNLKEIRRLRKERESQIYGEMVTGYIVYFVFLLVLVVLVKYLLPALTFSGTSASTFTSDTGLSGLSSGDIVNNYRSIFQWLIIVQSIFSGLVIGRLSEGELKAGGKHVAILLGIGYAVSAVLM